MFDGAVLSCRIHRLNDDEHTVLVMCIQLILHLRQLKDALFQQHFSLLLREHFMVVVGIEFFQFEPLPVTDLQFVDILSDLFQ